MNVGNTAQPSPDSNNSPDESTAGADDVTFESFDEETADELSPEDQVRKLKERLRKCGEEKATYLDGWQRAKADFINLKKREEEDRVAFKKFAIEGVIGDLIPVLESFHMAFANKEAFEKVDPSWQIGMKHIQSQFMQVLEGYGLKIVNPEGKEFDPNEHTSVGAIETRDPAKFHKIAEVLQLGYRLNGKLLRSPRVKIYTEAPRPLEGSGE